MAGLLEKQSTRANCFILSHSGNPFSPALESSSIEPPSRSPSESAAWRSRIALQSPSKRRTVLGLAALGNFCGICTYYVQDLPRRCEAVSGKDLHEIRGCIRRWPRRCIKRCTHAQDLFESKSSIQIVCCTVSTSMTCGGIHQH